MMQRNDARPFHRRTKAESHENEAGFTLVELLIAMGLGSLVVGLAFAAFGVFSNAGNTAVAIGKSTSAADTALAQIQSQVESANVLFNPATEGTRAGAGIPAGFSLRILTVVKGATTCEQWRVSSGDLQKRTWATGSTSSVPWATITTGVSNPRTEPPFSLASTTAYGGRMVNVDLVITASSNNRSGATTVDDSFTAFDAEFFSSSDTQFCTPVPKT